MGKLKPGTTYIYERANGVTYAREFGANPSERFEIGWDWSSEDQQRGRSLRDIRVEDKLWNDIRRLARTNETLQSELERVIMVYNLIKDDDPPDYHPV